MTGAVTTGYRRRRRPEWEGLDETRCFLGLLLRPCCSSPAPAAAGAAPAERASLARCARSTSGWRRSATGSRSPASTCAPSAHGCPASRSTTSRNMAPIAGRPRFAPSASTPGPACWRWRPAGRPSAPACGRRHPARRRRPAAAARRARRAAARSSRWSGSSPPSTRPSPTARAELAVRRGGERLDRRGRGRAGLREPLPARSRARGLNARADGRYVQVTHRDRRLCRRRRRAGRGARPRIRP